MAPEIAYGKNYRPLAGLQIRLIICLVTFLSSGFLNSPGLSVHCYGDQTKIVLTGFNSGKILWQHSSDGQNWTDLSAKDVPGLDIVIDKPGFFRALITSGNCIYYSDTTSVVLSDPNQCRERDSLSVIARRPTIGAIRWDAGWVGDVSPISVLSQRQLSPSIFRFRTPFFATVHKPDSVTFKYSQSVMDQEIDYAKNAGINYWIYDWYPDNSGFDIPLDLHLSSNRKSDIRFCFLFYSSLWEYVRKEFPLTMNRMKDPDYMKIDGKPLVFIMHNTWTKADITEMKEEAKKAGIPEIYLVVMEWTGETAIRKCTEYGAQASGAYCNWGDGGISYEEFATATENKWNTYKSPAYSFIPFVTTGWDPRPFIEFYKTCSYEDSLSLSQWYPLPNPDHWVQTATTSQVADHLKAGLNWVKNNSSCAKANTVIIYAWNECTEGGFIIPVAESDTNAINCGTARLDTIREMLDEYWKNYK
jgi:hypothetical protein